MTCRVFLAGEGPSDVGDLAHHPSYRRGREGFLQPLLRRLVGDDLTLEFAGQKLAAIGRDPRTGLEALGAKARQAVVLAGVDECSHLVFVTDVDKTQGKRVNRTERRKRISHLHALIEAGFAAAQAESLAVRTLVATPCRMIEAWAVADSERAPEDLWGDEDDPASNHPKCVLKRLHGRQPDFQGLGATVEIPTLVERCPDSFKPFHDQVQRALEDCPRAAGE